MKKIILPCIIIIVVVLILIAFSVAAYLEEGIMYKTFGFIVPLTAKREKIYYKTKDFFDSEEMKKIYLTKSQMKRVLKIIQQDDAWKNEDIDARLVEVMKRNTRDGIYNKIPNIQNKYWTFWNRNSGVVDSYSVDELLDYYFAVSFGVLDLDNNILYYYEYYG